MMGMPHETTTRYRQGADLLNPGIDYGNR